MCFCSTSDIVLPFLHFSLVLICGFSDDSGEVFQNGVAVCQDFIQRWFFCQVGLIQVVLTSPLDNFVVDVCDVHNVKYLVPKVVLNDTTDNIEGQIGSRVTHVTGIVSEKYCPIKI